MMRPDNALTLCSLRWHDPDQVLGSQEYLPLSPSIRTPLVENNIDYGKGFVNSVSAGNYRSARPCSNDCLCKSEEPAQSYHVIARRAKPDVAIRVPCGAKHRPSPRGGRKENGLPRRLSAPRNDRGRRWLVLLFFLRLTSGDFSRPSGAAGDS